MRRITTWGLLPLLFSPLAAQAAAEATDSTAPAWTRICENDAGEHPACVVEQAVTAMQQKNVVLRARFSRDATPDRARVLFLVPLGLPLASGLSLAVDASAPIILPFERCVPQGCSASAVLDGTALAQFFHGKTLTVRYAVSEKEGATISVPLAGLAAAFDTLSKQVSSP